MMIEAIFDYIAESFYIKAALAAFVILQIVSWFRTENLSLHYCKQNKLMSGFVKESKISEVQFKPAWWAFNPTFQMFSFIFTELLWDVLHAEKFERELIKT